MQTFASSAVVVVRWPNSHSLQTEAMRTMGVKQVHLALQPFLEGDARHGAAEGAQARGYVEGLIDGGAWTLSAAMLSFSYEDYTTPATIRKTGGIVPDEHWAANRTLIRAAAKLAAQFRAPYLTLHGRPLSPQTSARYFTRSVNVATADGLRSSR